MRANAMPVISESISRVKAAANNGLFRRIFKNSAMLTDGKIYTGLVGLIYLALATRALVPHDFGILILVHAYVTAIRSFTTLKTAQCVVRYGALSLESNDRASFQKLVKFTTLLDFGFCLTGTLLGMSAVVIVGPWFNITPELIPMTTIYCCAILFSFKSTSQGLLYLFNRFDLVAIMLMVVPSIRLIGACVAFVFYRDIIAFLMVWFIAGACNCLSTVYFGWREFKRQGFSENMDCRIDHLTRPHEKIWSFVWTSNIHRTLATGNVHFSTLAVGFLLGPVGAGLFKIAQESASVLVKPADLFNETMFPEMAKIVTSGSGRHLWKVITHSMMVAGAVAGCILLVVFVFGKPLLSLFFGTEFISSYEVLILLMIAAAIAMTTFALDPAMYAIGRPGIAMNIRIFTSLLHISVMIILLMEIGLPGAGIASIISSLATAVLLLFYACRLIKGVKS